MANVDPYDPPDLLSETGCFASLDPLEPTTGVIPYGIHAPLFSDGADKGRWMVVPDPATVASNGELEFAPGSVLLKHFSVDGRAVETRVMIRAAGNWAFHTYVWDGSDAERVLEGQTVDIGFDWEVPTAEACQFCHGAAARVLGPELGQLDVEVCYGGEPPQSQVAALRDWGLLSLGDIAVSSLVDPKDPTESLEDRARSYLHVNCGSCHRPGGWTPPNMTMDLRFETPMSETRLCGVPVQFMGDIANTEMRIDPGNPWESHLYIRMNGGGLGKMPPFGAHIDPDGLALIGAWIHSMDGCPD